MDDLARRARNAERLAQLFPTFAVRVRSVIVELEAAGLRPRIQDAWRSPEAQLDAFRTGHSKLRFGFHNVTGADGRPEALAVDLLDDDHAAREGGQYLLRLAAAAARQRCVTGIRWGLPVKLRGAIDAALANQHWDDVVKLGWDPAHVEPADLTVAEARSGVRPG